ncbi:hypothetical protein BCR32DRAFT_284938 [Anaeromyces robustus]|uniref:Uncharacterized protein n=1 Tax=Anaeromyces robustus TaxID=1754192 RepID=A0A1Y1WQ65_9FUNG|nr:hypothetical protein BCR32DRAFT_284938 [Anaeromyces robustus]|eukprot:ORX75687.1 hypothetical protein BCR32DRAFT_284938 [Anaeromyces robustus]
MKSFIFISYLVMVCTLCIEAAKTSKPDTIQIAFPLLGGAVATNDNENLMVETSIEYKVECIYNVNDNKIICKFSANNNSVEEFFRVTFDIKNTPSCTLTNNTKFTGVRSLIKYEGKLIESNYIISYKFDGKKFNSFSVNLRRFTITTNNKCTFTVKISRAILTNIKKSDY